MIIEFHFLFDKFGVQTGTSVYQAMYTEADPGH